MVVSKSVRMSVGIALAMSVSWLGGCSSSSSPGVTTPTATVRFEAGERASANAVEGFVSAVAGAYNRASASPAPTAQPAGIGVASADRFGMAGAAPGSCDSVALKYFNAQGQEQSAYDPATTTRIGAKGPCSTPQGVVTLDATADDAQASSSTVLVNGTAQGTYEGYNVQAVATNVRMTKQFCGAPASGVLVATTNGLVATIRFDGSLNAKATYTWNGIGVSFTVPLRPCQ
jgi:FlaG/FlaF family flagellin (archaellin)